MITRAAFRATLRAMLVDTVQYRDSQLNQWISDAIRDFSIWIPFTDTVSITTSAGVRSYVLNATTDHLLMQVTAVEYPTGESPRSMLTRLEERRSEFIGGQYYDINKQTTAVGGSYQELWFIVLGESPAANETIWIEYTRVHDVPTSDSDNLTVFDTHLEILRSYIMWRAALALEVDEEVSLVRKHEMIKALGGSSHKLERIYRDRLKAVIQGQSLITAWAMDRKDRIY